jgi:protein-tyrosine phosphatase
MVDIHCHILPEVDDGAASWEVALEMCHMATQDGITDIVATPHADSQYAYDRKRFAARLEQLQERAGERPKLSLGCDFHLSFENLQEAYRDPKRYTIGNTGYLLVEFSDFAIPSGITASLLRLLDIGITPILTHPERNPLLQRDIKRILEWVEKGCLVQVTASAVTGLWGEQAQRSARALLQQRAVHVLATDAHDARRRTPILSAARDLVAGTYGGELAQALVEHNPAAILSGNKIPSVASAKS